MAKLPPKSKKAKNSTREQLLNLDKNDLVEQILRLEAHNVQLKNIISKNLSSDPTCEDERKRKFNFSACHYRRVLLRIMYFGWDYQGLAVQEDSNQTIEHHLFHALTKSCLIESRELSQYHRCGRTDKGVSSFGQVISITLRSKFPPDQQHQAASISSEMQYCKILNRLLPKWIKAVAWMPLPKDRADYSARFDCKKRKYKYYFPRSNLDIQAMRSACQKLIGSHDFRHLCKMDVGNGVTEFRREVLSADIVPVGNDTDQPTSMHALTIEGNAFLWHQIRCIMGVLLLVGEGRERPGVLTELLDVERMSLIFSLAFIPVDPGVRFDHEPGFSESATSMHALTIEGSAFLWHQIRCIMGVLLLVGEGRERPGVLTELLDVEKMCRLDGFTATSMYTLLIEGNAFLWHQIRCIMGVLLLVGARREGPEVVTELLDVERNPRKPQYSMALDIPLNLFHCTYDLEAEQQWVYDEDELKSLIRHFQTEWTIENIKTTMIKDSLEQLEKVYASLGASETDKQSERDGICAYTDCLIQGVKPRTYVPLLKREMCSSLEDRIEYYRKKSKIEDKTEMKEESSV